MFLVLVLLVFLLILLVVFLVLLVLLVLVMMLLFLLFLLLILLALLLLIFLVMLLLLLLLVMMLLPLTLLLFIINALPNRRQCRWIFTSLPLSLLSDYTVLLRSPGSSSLSFLNDVLYTQRTTPHLHITASLYTYQYISSV
mgnify:CR=1 FL=1